jgi:hypothetical protein
MTLEKAHAFQKVLWTLSAIAHYLSPSHAYGRRKASFFTIFGFSADAGETLAQALLQHAAENEVLRLEDSPFGQRYIVDGEARATARRKPRVRAIWFIETGEEVPYLVIAYPLENAYSASRD